MTFSLCAGCGCKLQEKTEGDIESLETEGDVGEESGQGAVYLIDPRLDCMI